jgi:MYXO-CTERM domain-containing protein
MPAAFSAALPSAAALAAALTISLPAQADVPPLPRLPPPDAATAAAGEATAIAVFTGAEGYDGVTMDGEPRPDLLTPGEHAIPAGAHRFVFTGEAGPPAQVAVVFTPGQRQTVGVPTPSCGVPLGGVALPVEHHAGGCCGGSQGPSESASTKGSLLAVGAVALALSRRRRKK